MSNPDRKWMLAGVVVGIVACCLVGMSFVFATLSQVGFYDYNFEVFHDENLLNEQQKLSLQRAQRDLQWLPMMPLLGAFLLLLGFLGLLLFRMRKCPTS